MLGPTLGPQMVKKSFIFIPGVGYKTEEYLWRKGVVSWSHLNGELELTYLSENKKSHIKNYVRKGYDALENRDISFFAESLPQHEHWRLYRDFRDRAVFLDVETTGLSHYYDNITLVGAFDGRQYRIFVKDNNLDDFVKFLKAYDIIVTFNGKLFDVPFIKKEFPELAIRQVHLDLRFLLRSVGIGGPLKAIEEKLGIHRRGEVADVSGREAAVLWGRFVKGDDEAFRRLVMYNVYDTTNLRALMDYCYLRKFHQDVFPSIKKHESLKKSRAFTRLSIDSVITRRRSLLGKLTLESNPKFLSLYSKSLLPVKVNKTTIQRKSIDVDVLLDRITALRQTASVVGIDLSGSKKRPTGICVLSGKNCNLNTAFTDKEIIERTMSAHPSIVSIDSPLSLPKGRDCTSDNCSCRRYGITREIERILKSRGINIYPCLIPSMQKLTKRGITLAHALRRRRVRVIESYPGAAQDILGFPRKRVNLADLKFDLMSTGIIPLSDQETVSHHELDALTSALVGYFYLADMYEPVGRGHEGSLIIPRLLYKGKERNLLKAGSSR